jgi:two-component system sensor histidine kinase and response regulator WspE
MGNEADLSDASLIDLFRAEVETHAEVLSSALLELERTPGDSSRVNEMMRAAHSIKGASRIVGVDAAGRIAHVMEDCFVAAQKETIKLSSSDVDVLLRGVDMLERVSAATRDPGADLEALFGGCVRELEVELQAVLTGKHSPPTAPAASMPPGSPSAKPVSIAFPELLNRDAAENARHELLSALGARPPAIGLDLGRTRDLDADGLAFLAAIPAFLSERRGPAIRLEQASAEMATVLRVTGLAQSFGPVLGAKP